MIKKTLLFIGSFAALIPQAFAGTDNSSPIVLELYTSQSCSSCPPADQLLKELYTKDKNLLPLSFHVDYWDHLNWKDPFSSAVNTKRQKDYAARMGENGIYTPQLIINGQEQMIGSRKDDVLSAIETAKKTVMPIQITLTEHDKKITAHFESAASFKNANAVIWLAYFDTAATTSITDGENEGKTLQSIHNVIELKSAGALSALPQDNQLSFNAPQQGGVAILAQEENTGPIMGAASYLKE